MRVAQMDMRGSDAIERCVVHRLNVVDSYDPNTPIELPGFERGFHFDAESPIQTVVDVSTCIDCFGVLLPTIDEDEHHNVDERESEIGQPIRLNNSLSKLLHLVDGIAVVAR